jgi:hypothetical protein
MKMPFKPSVPVRLPDQNVVFISYHAYVCYMCSAIRPGEAYKCTSACTMRDWCWVQYATLTMLSCRVVLCCRFWARWSWELRVQEVNEHKNHFCISNHCWISAFMYNKETMYWSEADFQGLSWNVWKN